MLVAMFCVAMTFVNAWRMRSLKSHLLQFMSWKSSAVLYKTQSGVTPIQAKLVIDEKVHFITDVLQITQSSRMCRLRPIQFIDIERWFSTSDGMPFWSKSICEEPDATPKLCVFIECEMIPHADKTVDDIIHLESLGPVWAWRAHENLEFIMVIPFNRLCELSFKFLYGLLIVNHRLPVIRIQTVYAAGKPFRADDNKINILRNIVRKSTEIIDWENYGDSLKQISKEVFPDISTETKVLEAIESDSTSENLPSLPSQMSLAPEGQSCDESHVDTVEVPLKPPAESVLTQTSHTIEPSSSIITRESVAIHQKLTPARSSENRPDKVVSTTIQSVTTHRRVTVNPSNHDEQIPSTSSGIRASTAPVESKPKKKRLTRSKLLNILVYSESVVARNNLITTLNNVLDPNRYTVYPATLDVLSDGAWRGNVALIALVGNTGEASSFLLKYFLDGGRLLAICSDLLQTVVPYYRTAEIRENEIVQFSYDKWKSVKMKHHVLCFQASPAKKQFSTESDRQASQDNNICCVMNHELVIDVIANEETWRTPSLIQVQDDTSSGVAIFSQIHLETNPAEYLGEEGMKNNRNRYEILLKILGDILKLYVKNANELPNIDYTEGYFFGDEKRINGLLAEMSADTCLEKRKIKSSKLELEWMFAGQEPSRKPSENFLPVHVHKIPPKFSYNIYRENLTSSELGQTLLYTDVVSSTEEWNEIPMVHGLAVITGRQLKGRGRSKNLWISPPGQAIISLQIWTKLTSHVPVIQNVAALAVVNAIRSNTPYEKLNIRIKWPNDIYYGREAKIGGISVKAQVTGDLVHINLGTGLNISNSVPTTCVNDIIKEYNLRNRTKLQPIVLEWFLARYCSHLESLLSKMETEAGKTAFYKEYYNNWLHNNERIEILNEDGSRVSGTIHGIDGAGFLLVNTVKGRLTVNPNGNSFDIMANLIARKI